MSAATPLADTPERATILITDDEPANLAVLSEVLQGDYRVRAVRTGEQALRAAASQPRPDLILLDIMMPEMDGYEVCRRLKETPTTTGIPVIFVTARGEAQDERKGFDLGAVDYITKPIKSAVVAARVRTHIELARALRRLEASNARLIEAAQMRDNIDRILRHDLKAPLGGIISVPDLLQRSENLSEGGKKLLSLVRTGGYKMLEMINLSLDMYKMETGQYRLDPQPVDLGAVLDNVFTEQGVAFRSKALEWRVEMEGKPIDGTAGLRISGEEMLCYSLFSNIVKNAVEASGQGDGIVVRLAATDGQAVVSVCNRGVIPESIRDRFFDKYVTAGKSKGTGLGTYSAKLLTEAQHGTIAFTTDRDGGTELTVTLPLAVAEGCPAATQDNGR